MTISNMSEHEIRTALTYIDAQNRDVWVKVGTALKTEFGESGFALFDEWSSQASNYRLNDAKTAFKSFQIGKSNIGYLINQAKQNGWQREKPQGLAPDKIRQREERNAQIAKQAEIERQEKAFQAALFAQNVWKNAKTADKNHPYLQRKGITHPAVLEVIRQEKEALIIPLKNHGEIVGIQKIFADGNKRFNRDIEKKGSAFVIGNRDEMHHGFLLAEGFATAATLHQATEKPVVVAFDAGNLQSVAQNLKAFVEKHHTPVLICADKDDSQTGETKAMLAKKVLGDYAQVVLPDFTADEIQSFQAAQNGKTPTDFNDLQTIAGIERVQNTLSGCLNNGLIESVNSEFANAIDRVAETRIAGKSNIYLGRTPDVWKLIGIDDVRVSIHEKVIRKAMGEYINLQPDEHDYSHIHNLTPETLKKLPESLNNPIAVFKSAPTSNNPNGYLVLTELMEKDKKTGKEKPVVAALYLHKRNDELRFVNISTAFGSEDKYIQNYFNQSKDLLKYWNTEKGRNFWNAGVAIIAKPTDFQSVLDSGNVKTEKDLMQYRQEQYSNLIYQNKDNPMAEQNKLTKSPPLEKHTFTPDTWQPETPTFENRIDFADDRQMVMDEVERANKPEMTPQEKVQAAFETLQNQHNGYRYNPETQKVEVLESKTGEEIHYQADVEKLIYSAVDNGERKTIGDIDIKDLTPEYLALSIENRRLSYQQELLQNGFPNETKRQALNQKADQLDESVRLAKRQTKLLTPPDAPPYQLSERYLAVKHRFMDNATHYGEKTNTGVKARVDYIDAQNGKTVLFSNKGNKLTTSKNPDAQTVKDMVEVAKAKGWDSVKLRGNREFKRLAFIEMESQGIKTKGYSPTPQDLAMVEKLREERSLSGIENISGSLKNKPQPPEKTLSQEAKAFFDELHNNPTADKGGVLLAHGKDNFQFKKDASKSYFATIQYPDGEKTYWGKDIERLLQEQNINIGDRIELQKTGKIENVRVEEVLRDEQGEPILDENGQPQYEEVMHQRNVWEVNVYQHSSNETTSSLNKSASTSKKQSFEQVQHDYNQAKATLSPKQQEYLAVAERLLHHAFEKGRISSHTQEYYLGNFYRHTTAEIKNGTIDIPNPYTKSSKVRKTQSINKPKTQTKGVDI